MTHYVIMKTLNKRELQQIISNHTSDIDFKFRGALSRLHQVTIFIFSLELLLDMPLRFPKKLIIKVSFRVKIKAILKLSKTSSI